jgi:isopenicillin-N epimerase
VKPVSSIESFAQISRDEWLLDPDVAFLNHGSFGATPRTVLAEQDRWRVRIERHPTHFMTDALPPALRAAAARLAAFVGSDAKDLVFVENATAGCNTVLNSLPLAAGDEILVTDHGYAAVRKAAEHVAARAGARVVEAAVPFPLADPAQIIAAVAGRLGPRVRHSRPRHLAHGGYFSDPRAHGALPCRRRARPRRWRARARHALPRRAVDRGRLVHGQLPQMADGPEGQRLSVTDPARQADTHPLVISHGFGQGFTAAFDWIGTRDPTAWLAVPAAIDFHLRLGGPALRERNAALAREQAARLAHVWNTERGAPDPLTGSMAAVRLPLRDPATPERAQELRTKLFAGHRIEVPVIAVAGALWARISAQAYNQPADYARLAACFHR